MDFFKEGKSVNWGVPGAASSMLDGKALMYQSMGTTQSIIHCSDKETEAQKGRNIPRSQPVTGKARELAQPLPIPFCHRERSREPAPDTRTAQASAQWGVM